MSKKKLTRNFWRSYFKVYDILNRLIPYIQTLDAIADRIPDKSFKILDVGCGTGNLIETLCKRGFLRIVGCDYSEYALKLAGEKMKKYSSDVSFYCLDITQSLSPCGSDFEVVVMNNVLYTIDREGRLPVLQNIFKVLKPGGIIIASNINVNFKPVSIYLDHIRQSVQIKGLTKTLLEMISFIIPTVKMFYYNELIKSQNSQGAYHFFNKGEQERLLVEAGFDITSPETVTYSGSAYLLVGEKRWR